MHRGGGGGGIGGGGRGGGGEVAICDTVELATGEGKYHGGGGDETRGYPVPVALIALGVGGIEEQYTVSTSENTKRQARSVRK